MGDEESPGDKLLRRSKENPIVPVGIFAAVAACGYAAYDYKNRGNMRTSVYLVQLRVIAQGCVVGACALTAASILYKRLTHTEDKKK